MEVVKDVYNGWNDNGDLEEIKKCPFCGGKAILVEHPLGSLWITDRKTYKKIEGLSPLFFLIYASFKKILFQSAPAEAGDMINDIRII